MTRMVVVEGPDGAGKSTLVKQLSETMGREIFHSGGPPRTPEEWTDRRIKFFAMKDKPVLVDRLPHISEQCYGPLYGRHGPYFALTDEVREMGPVVIYCRLKSTTDMMARIGREKKSYKPDEHMRLLLADYYGLVDRYDWLIGQLESRNLTPVIRYSWQDDSFEDLIRKIEACAV